jgi:flavin reductase (DIM6/NTAB) family NADH-FMN oxidoreductase RutF
MAESFSSPSPELLNKVLWRIPNVLCLLGSRHDEEWNAMTQSWVTQVSMEPVLVAASVDASAVTNRLIRGGGSFSINLWDRADTKPFVRFSKPAVFEAMELNGLPVREGVTGVPVFVDAVAYLECVVHRIVECGTHDVFFGEVVDAGLRAEDEAPSIARMEDTRMKYGGVKRGGH